MDIENTTLPAFDFTLVVQAHITNEFDEEGPEYAEIRVTPQLVDDLVLLSRLCKEHDLETVSKKAEVRWDRENDLRIVGSSILLSERCFWVEGYPKYSTNVETVIIGIADMLSMVYGDTSGARFRRVGNKFFYAESQDDIDNLIKLYEEAGATYVCDECGCYTDEVIGCPDGSEICRECFDQGAH